MSSPQPTSNPDSTTSAGGEHNKPLVEVVKKQCTHEVSKNRAFWVKVFISTCIVIFSIARLLKGNPDSSEQTVLYSLLAFAIGSFAPNPKYEKLVEIADDIRKGDFAELANDVLDMIKPPPTPPSTQKPEEEKK